MRCVKGTRQKHIECIVCMLHTNEGFRYSSVFAFTALQLAIDILFRRQVDRIWQKNPVSESQLENLLLVLAWHQLELQKYIWDFYCEEHDKGVKIPCMIVNVVVTQHHRRPSTQISRKPVVLGYIVAGFGWFCRWFWLVLLVVLGGFGSFRVLV